jgi:hypothetical protein
MAIQARLSIYRCAACGYGAACKAQPESCPMCRGSIWSSEGSEALRSLLDDLDPSELPLRRGSLDEPFTLS